MEMKTPKSQYWPPLRIPCSKSPLPTTEGESLRRMRHISLTAITAARIPGRKPEGTGLGLAIVKGIAELHGGSISVFSLQHQASRLLYGSPGAKPVLLNIPADSRTLFQIDFPLIKVN